MEITYHWEGDYLIPDLKHSHMLLSETLWKHLAKVDEECNEMMDRLVGQMAKKEGVTEQSVGEQSSPIALKMPMMGFCM